MGRAAIPAKREPTSAIDPGTIPKAGQFTKCCPPNRNETALFEQGFRFFRLFASQNREKQ
jgi:hypothetical protein